MWVQIIWFVVKPAPHQTNFQIRFPEEWECWSQYFWLRLQSMDRWMHRNSEVSDSLKNGTLEYRHQSSLLSWNMDSSWWFSSTKTRKPKSTLAKIRSVWKSWWKWLIFQVSFLLWPVLSSSSSIIWMMLTLSKYNKTTLLNISWWIMLCAKTGFH